MSRRKNAAAELKHKLVTDEEWIAHLAAIERRLNRLKAAREGNAVVIKIWRSGYRVRAHDVRPHYVYLIKAKPV